MLDIQLLPSRSVKRPFTRRIGDDIHNGRKAATSRPLIRSAGPQCAQSGFRPVCVDRTDGQILSLRRHVLSGHSAGSAMLCDANRRNVSLRLGRLTVARQAQPSLVPVAALGVESNWPVRFGEGLRTGA